MTGLTPGPQESRAKKVISTVKVPEASGSNPHFISFHFCGLKCVDLAMCGPGNVQLSPPICSVVFSSLASLIQGSVLTVFFTLWFF